MTSSSDDAWTPTRRYAQSDDPIEDTSFFGTPRRCVACGSRAVTLIHLEPSMPGPGGEYYEIWEVKCLDCGVYSNGMEVNL